MCLQQCSQYLFIEAPRCPALFNHWGCGGGGFKRTRITVLVCYSLDLQCIPRASMLKMLWGHWGMVETYRGEVSWEEAKSWLLGPPRE